MINRFTLAALAAAFALTGCVKHSIDEPVAEKPAPDFSTGATLVTITHVSAPTADGGPIFVTVDGNEAGAVATGESVVLHLPAGKHQVGGYARSLIGHVTVPPVQITTKTTSAKHVAYTMIKSKPTFAELKDDPIPQAPQTTATPQTTTASPAAVTPQVSSATTTPATATPETTTPATTPATVTPEASSTTVTPEATSTTVAPETTPTTATPEASSTTATPQQ